MDLILLIAIVLLMIIVIALIIVITFQGLAKIKPSECPLSKGNYGLAPGKKIIGDGGNLAILSTCGLSGNQLCSANADNLLEATEYCISNYQACNVFSYSGGIVNILDEKGNEVSDVQYDLYYRQYRLL
jgi:hypothetical protein